MKSENKNKYKKCNMHRKKFIYTTLRSFPFQLYIEYNERKINFINI